MAAGGVRPPFGDSPAYVGIVSSEPAEICRLQQRSRVARPRLSAVEAGRDAEKREAPQLARLRTGTAPIAKRQGILLRSGCPGRSTSSRWTCQQSQPNDSPRFGKTTWLAVGPSGGAADFCSVCFHPGPSVEPAAVPGVEARDAAARSCRATRSRCPPQRSGGGAIRCAFQYRLPPAMARPPGSAPHRKSPAVVVAFGRFQDPSAVAGSVAEKTALRRIRWRSTMPWHGSAAGR